MTEPLFEPILVIEGVSYERIGGNVVGDRRVSLQRSVVLRANLHV